jgi:hypothetical protein
LECGRPALLGELLDHREGLPKRRSRPAEALLVGNTEESEIPETAPLVERNRCAAAVQVGRHGCVHGGRDLGGDRADLSGVVRAGHGHAFRRQGRAALILINNTDSLSELIQ